jgi:putative transposase
MKRNRFTEEQIIGILRKQEVGTKTAHICRKHGISDATFYKSSQVWRSRDIGRQGAESA